MSGVDAGKGGEKAEHQFVVDISTCPLVQQKLVAFIHTSIVDDCGCEPNARTAANGGAAATGYHTKGEICHRQDVCSIGRHCGCFDVSILVFVFVAAVGEAAFLTAIQQCKGYIKHCVWLKGHVRQMKDGTADMLGYSYDNTHECDHHTVDMS